MHQELYIRWLNDAYAMEQAIDKMLTQQIKATELSEIREKIEEHRDLTHHHGDLIKGRIEALGEDVSDMKAGTAKVFGILDGLMMGMPEDKLVKNMIGNYAVEAFEIACYSSLATAAQMMEDTETQEICETIRQQELAMAEWIAQQIPAVTQQLITQKEQQHAS